MLFIETSIRWNQLGTPLGGPAWSQIYIFWAFIHHYLLYFFTPYTKISQFYGFFIYLFRYGELLEDLCKST